MFRQAGLWKPIAVAAFMAAVCILAVTRIADLRRFWRLLYGTLLVHVFLVGLVISGCALSLSPTDARGAEEG